MIKFLIYRLSLLSMGLGCLFTFLQLIILFFLPRIVFDKLYTKFVETPLKTKRNKIAQEIENRLNKNDENIN